MIVECYQDNKLRASHRCSAELTHKEILERFGLKDRRWTVQIHEEGRPDLGRVIQREEINS